MENNLVTIRANKGLNSLVSGNGEHVSAQLFKQKEKNRKEGGEYVSDYDDRPFPTSKKYFAPLWDTLRKQYPWGANNATFKQIVDDLMLKYPKGHPKQGEFIVASDVTRHQKDFNDPIFSHPKLQSKTYITGGRGTFNLEIPIEAFMYYTMSNRRDVLDDSTAKTGRTNPLVKNNATLLFSSPEKANIRKRKSTDYILGAMSAIDRSKNDIKRLRAYAIIFNIPGIGVFSDANEIVNTLTQYVQEYGGKIQKNSGYNSLNESIVAHDQMDDTELQMRFAIKLARDRGVLKTSKEGFFLKDKLISGPTTLNEIYQYFNSENEKANENLVILLERMRELKQLE